MHFDRENNTFHNKQTTLAISQPNNKFHHPPYAKNSDCFSAVNDLSLHLTIRY